MFITSLNKAYIRCEWEIRHIANWDPVIYEERDLTGGRETWGKGRDRRPGKPLAAGWVGYVSLFKSRP